MFEPSGSASLADAENVTQLSETLLQRPLSADANARYLRVWKSLFPAPPPVSYRTKDAVHRTADEMQRQLAEDFEKYLFIYLV